MIGGMNTQNRFQVLFRFPEMFCAECRTGHRQLGLVKNGFGWSWSINFNRFGFRERQQSPIAHRAPLLFEFRSPHRQQLPFGWIVKPDQVLVSIDPRNHDIVQRYAARITFQANYQRTAL